MRLLLFFPFSIRDLNPDLVLNLKLLITEWLYCLLII